jgi:hypothetical protein
MSDRIIEVEGLGAVLRAFGKLDKRLRGELRAELAELAVGVAEKAREIAEAKGLRRSGDLISRIRPGARASYAYVADSARHRGFNYPARLEFENHGERAFLRPARDAESEHVVRGVEALLDRLTSEEGLQKGGTL